MAQITEIIENCLAKDDVKKQSGITDNLFYDKSTDSYYKISAYEPSKFDTKNIIKELSSSDYYLRGVLDLDMIFPHRNLSRYNLYRLCLSANDTVVFNYKGTCNNSLKKIPGTMDLKWMALPQVQRTYLLDILDKWLSSGIIDDDTPNCKITIFPTAHKEQIKIKIPMTEDFVRKEEVKFDDDGSDDDDLYGRNVQFSDVMMFPQTSEEEEEKGFDVTDFEDIEKYYSKGCECYYGKEPDRIEKAAYYFKKAAEFGDMDAQYILGMMYYNGELGDGNKRNAILQFRSAAKYGDTDAQDWLGWMYYKGEGVKKNLHVAAEWYNKAAVAGNVDAQYNLGALYCDPEFSKRDFNTARKWLTKAMKRNDERAKNMLSYIDKVTKGSKDKMMSGMPQGNADNAKEEYTTAINHLFGNNVEKDVRKGMELMMAAADKGNVQAQLFLGKTYNKGTLVEKDEILAKKYFNDAVNNGSADAELHLADMLLASNDEEERKSGYEHVRNASKNGSRKAILRLADYYMKGEYFKKDINEAMIIYRDLSEKGDSNAQYNLGKLCLGDGEIKANMDEAAKWLVHSVASSNYRAMNLLVSAVSRNEYPGLAERTIVWIGETERNQWTDYLYGRMCLDGIGMEKNVEEGMKILERSGRNGNPTASCLIGMIYQNGRPGVRRDYNKAIQFYEMSASENNLQAVNNLAWIYTHSIGAWKDVDKGLKLYEKAISKGFAESYYDYGILYLNGKIVPQDLKKGAENIKKAADMNYVRAIDAMASMYLNGTCYPRDVQKAISIYEKLASEGSTNALCSLGMIFLSGNGIEKDFAKAEKYLTESAEQGYYEAEYQLYNLFKETDADRALEWLKKAADHGHEFASQELADYYLSKGTEADDERAMKVYESMVEKGIPKGAFLMVNELIRRNNPSSKAEAVEILKQQSDNGSPRAMYRLWKMYTFPEYDMVDHETAMKYLKMSAEYGFGKAEATMAQELESGDYIEKDLAMSLEYAKRAVAKNEELGYLILANKYRKGIGVETDNTEAFILTKAVAEMGNRDAMEELGTLLKKGIGVEKNPEAALEWFMKSYNAGNPYAGLRAAKLMLEKEMDIDAIISMLRDIADTNNTDALVMLGNIYYDNDYARVNTEKAISYYRTAAAKGNPGAIEILKKLDISDDSIQ